MSLLVGGGHMRFTVIPAVKDKLLNCGWNNMFHRFMSLKTQYVNQQWALVSLISTSRTITPAYLRLKTSSALMVKVPPWTDIAQLSIRWNANSSGGGNELRLPGEQRGDGGWVGPDALNRDDTLIKHPSNSIDRMTQLSSIFELGRGSIPLQCPLFVLWHPWES